MRYSAIHTIYGLDFIPRKNGNWVKFSDYQELETLARKLCDMDEEIHSRLEYIQCRKELMLKLRESNEHIEPTIKCPGQLTRALKD